MRHLLQAPAQVAYPAHQPVRAPLYSGLLPDIMQVLNSESQAGESGRSLNISVSAAAMSPNASADDAPTFSGSLANATVESSPRRVDVQGAGANALVC